MIASLDKLPRFVRYVLPGLMALTWLGLLTSLVSTVVREPPRAEILTVDGGSWRVQQAFRLTCGFSLMTPVAENDALWTACWDDGWEIVRFSLADGIIERGWKLPDVLQDGYEDRTTGLDVLSGGSRRRGLHADSSSLRQTGMVSAAAQARRPAGAVTRHGAAAA